MFSALGGQRFNTDDEVDKFQVAKGIRRYRHQKASGKVNKMRN